MGNAMTVDQLRDLPVLASLDDEEVAGLAAAGRERRLAAGEFLFRQGDRASAFHLVLDGQLETTREIAGEQVLMMNHGTGGFLGAMALGALGISVELSDILGVPVLNPVTIAASTAVEIVRATASVTASGS